MAAAAGAGAGAAPAGAALAGTGSGAAPAGKQTLRQLYQGTYFLIRFCFFRLKRKLNWLFSVYTYQICTHFSRDTIWWTIALITFPITFPIPPIG